MLPKGKKYIDQANAKDRPDVATPQEVLEHALYDEDTHEFSWSKALDRAIAVSKNAAENAYDKLVGDSDDKELQKKFKPLQVLSTLADVAVTIKAAVWDCRKESEKDENKGKESQVYAQCLCTSAVQTWLWPVCKTLAKGIKGSKKSNSSTPDATANSSTSSSTNQNSTTKGLSPVENTAVRTLVADTAEKVVRQVCVMAGMENEKLIKIMSNTVASLILDGANEALAEELCKDAIDGIIALFSPQDGPLSKPYVKAVVYAPSEDSKQLLIELNSKDGYELKDADFGDNDSSSEEVK